ncbi:alpha/beta hydrolase [Microbacterium betulae]|uniref:Alpha/beta hydrolase n=1 Tax=Microbacterium betulae TaxID=2981139 RepID=A0AA97I6Q4_9MICO|nr:alpha/beta hydrolase [Microbacterium sp. AB]WOF24089.1 alpha/beta hydrolase [Microbacterium sp. AB]
MTIASCTLRRLTAVVAGAAAVSVALSGCLYAQIPAEDSGSESAAPTTGAEPATDGVPEELLPFYDQQLEWGSCGDGFQCTTVTAPLDWENPEAGEIDLAVVRQPALSGQAQGSLLTNPGGPGGSGVSFILDSVDYAVGQALQESFDVVGWDPRGVGESTAVRCFDAAEMDAFLYDIPEAERGTEEWEAELEARAEGFADACEANSDGILEFITTEQSSRDLDLLRGVLGETELDYLGYSYGTFLGATYAKNFPGRVGRLVLDGAIDPSTSGEDVGVTQAVGFEAALRTYMQACLDGGTGEGCPFTGTVDDAMGDLAALLAAVDANPLRSSQDDRLLGADSLMTGVIAALYNEANWPYLTEALAGALEGDSSIAFLLADSYNGREGGEYVDNSTEAFNAYNCMDYPAESEQAIEETEQRIAEEAPTIAPYWTGASVCEYWPYEPTGVREEIAAEGAPPILVIGTTGDPATPYEWAEALADQLASGVLLTYEGEGHTAYNGASTCVDEAVEAFFTDEIVPEDGLVCS